MVYQRTNHTDLCNKTGGAFLFYKTLLSIVKLECDMRQKECISNISTLLKTFFVAESYNCHQIIETSFIIYYY